MNVSYTDATTIAPPGAGQHSDLVVCERLGDGVVRLTLNDPAKRNALSRAMILALHGWLDRIAAEPDCYCIILAASGPVFCAGHDLRELRANRDDADFTQGLFERCSALMQRIVSLPQPVIAQVQGVATAAGCQLVASCDLAIAAEQAGFMTPGVNIGLFCSTPMVAVSRNIPRKRIMEMLLTGEQLSAEQAVNFGLINRAVPADALNDAVWEMAHKIATKPHSAIRIGKEAFYRQMEYGLSDAYAYCGRVMASNMLEADATEGIQAFIDKREPVWQSGSGMARDDRG